MARTGVPTYLTKFRRPGLIVFAEGLAFVGLGLLIRRIAGRPSDIVHLGVVLSIVGLGVFLIAVFSSLGGPQEQNGDG